MVGTPTDKEKLNFTLEKVCNILDEHKIDEWFIMHGTLLGIIREGSCIEGDDDLDILLPASSYENIKSIFKKEGFEFTSDFGIGDSTNILKTVPSDKYASIDFYMFEKNESGDVYHAWDNITVINCYPIIKKEWRSQTLNLPNEYLKKIINMYGENWQTPSGGGSPMNATF